MKWKDLTSGAFVPAENESSGDTIKYSVVFEMKAIHNQAHFIDCYTYFDTPQRQKGFADNIPINDFAFNKIYTLPLLNVYCKYLIIYDHTFCYRLSAILV